jgi:D-tyrosyl-tRNA(Tyr) deacylase
MKLIIQRVTKGSVAVNTKIVGSIGAGYVVLVGIKVGDTKTEANKLSEKLLNLRIMADKNDHMNLSILDTKGEMLLISQFTLYANTKGRRPGFTAAMPPKEAQKIFDYFVNKLKESKLDVKTGEFSAIMNVSLVNSGPVTIVLEENSTQPVKTK